MLIRIGENPVAGFDRPIAMMSDCHRRVERFLGMLATIGRRNGASLSDEEGRAIDAALGYFRIGAPRHTADEEESLFPRLRATGDSCVAATLAKLDALESDHRRAAPSHARIEEFGAQWLADGTLPPVVAEEFTRRGGDLIAIYGKHIAIEDTEIFPVAENVLADDEKVALAREMRARRGS